VTAQNFKPYLFVISGQHLSLASVVNMVSAKPIRHHGGCRAVGRKDMVSAQAVRDDGFDPRRRLLTVGLVWLVGEPTERRKLTYAAASVGR